MKIKLNKKFNITDNTNEVDKDTLLLSTKTNKKYTNVGNYNLIYPSDIINEFKLHKIKLVGITGTNGKTTTASIIYSLLLDLGYSVALLGSRGFYINDKLITKYTFTTPFNLELYNNIKIAVENKCKFFIMEVSSHAIEQDRIEGLYFFLKIHTNITRDHLDYHKTLENYLFIKHKFLVDNSAKTLVNCDDKNLKLDLISNKYSYSILNNSDFKLEAYSLDGYLNGVISSKKESVSFTSNLSGYFNLYNIVASISAVNILTNKKLSNIVDMLPNFGGIKGRMEVVSTTPFVVIDFAHTPDAMKNVFEAFKKDIIVVFGAGGDRDRLKRPLMAKMACKYAKKVIITTDNPRNENENQIIDDIVTGMDLNIYYKIIKDRYDAIKYSIEHCSEGSIILILGKGDEEYQIQNGVKSYFSDTEAVIDILSKD